MGCSFSSFLRLYPKRGVSKGQRRYPLDGILMLYSFRSFLVSTFFPLKVVWHLSLPAAASVPTCPQEDQLPFDSADTPRLSSLIKGSLN